MTINESIVESAALDWFAGLGYAVAHGPHLAPGEPDAERDSFSQVLLVGRLRDAIARLNPAIPADAREDALRRVVRIATPSLIQTNRAFHKLLRDGVEVEYRRPDGSIAGDHVRLVDFTNSAANDWLVVNQLTVIEGQHNRRPDLVVFVNGLPLGVIELKNAADENATIWSAYAQVQTYKAEIPSLLQYNAVLVVSDGLQARMGSLTANQEPLGLPTGSAGPDGQDGARPGGAVVRRVGVAAECTPTPPSAAANICRSAADAVSPTQTRPPCPD